eukprot:gnl/MRDRNA2_/MRDRNA2_273165_c0_seq1.p1 gnl/MRDRNA2_/MRDRNA2_273165_c0~~gnl/MRDRNA2_/MRDRNA2_273165_c0_seq1.p1  ORF type:complete len:140 (-),score=2.96 gnl/MRDRNA2_/MRDRNA2_273165_c0_seq1:93-512(-)
MNLIRGCNKEAATTVSKFADGQGHHYFAASVFEIFDNRALAFLIEDGLLTATFGASATRLAFMVHGTLPSDASAVLCSCRTASCSGSASGQLHSFTQVLHFTHLAFPRRHPPLGCCLRKLLHVLQTCRGHSPLLFSLSF